MEIRKRFVKDIVVLYVAENIDIDSAALIEETGRLLKEGLNKILCNFTNVNIVDYNGLSILAIAYKNVTNQDGAIKFCAVPSHIKELFKMARLDMVFEIFEDEKTALRNFDLSSKVDNLSLRRRFKRIDVSIPMRYKESLSSESRMHKGKILNLSGEGLFVYSKATFPASTQLYVEIELSKTKKPVTLMGVVMYLADRQIQPHSYPGMGIKFSTITPEIQKEIVSFIEKNLIGRTRV